MQIMNFIGGLGLMLALPEVSLFSITEKHLSPSLVLVAVVTWLPPT